MARRLRAPAVVRLPPCPAALHPAPQAIASSPELYPELARSGAIPTLLSLLNHENGDIAADVIELFQELTDADVVEDSVGGARQGSGRGSRGHGRGWGCGGGMMGPSSRPARLVASGVGV